MKFKLGEYALSMLDKRENKLVRIVFPWPDDTYDIMYPDGFTANDVRGEFLARLEAPDTVFKSILKYNIGG